MQTPIRRGGIHTHLKPDPHITEDKLNELKRKLDGLYNSRPHAISEVKRLAEMGDFSENAGYQMAKGRLRGINQRILDLEDQITKAIIIKPDSSGKVSLGSVVTVEVNGIQKIYTILGSAETDPSRGVISHNSPIGSALMGKRVGDVIGIKIGGRDSSYKVILIK